MVRFARDDPETPQTMDEQVALAHKAAQKLGVPNCESKPLYRSELSHRRGLGLRRVDLGGASVNRFRVTRSVRKALMTKMLAESRVAIETLARLSEDAFEGDPD